eukprot:2278016-Pyramimonas_sp.AAC.1
MGYVCAGLCYRAPVEKKAVSVLSLFYWGLAYFVTLVLCICHDLFRIYEAHRGNTFINTKFDRGYVETFLWQRCLRA